MAHYSKNPNQPSAEDKALDRFTELMIEKIKSMKDNWHKPWFTEGALVWTRNLTGRHYNGANALMLMLHAEKEGYKMPVWCTFNSIQKILNPELKAGTVEGREPVHVLKGKKSFPVFLTTYTVIDRETREKISWDDYKKLSDKEKERYNVFPKNQVFNVFNAAQTNLQQVRPDLYDKLEEQCSLKPPVHEGEMFSFPVIDAMIANNAWICPIKLEKQDDAYYSHQMDHIVMPLKEQFYSGENFYGTALHEMTHSTGSQNRLNRLKAARFGDKEYAREELVAELGAALVCQQIGILKHVKEDSATYLKSWIKELEESPDFIKTVLSDVKKATAVISFRMQEVQQQLDNGQQIRPYTQDDAALDPTLVDEVPFKGTPMKNSDEPCNDNKSTEASKRENDDRMSDIRIKEEEEQTKSEEVSQSEEERENTSRGRCR